MNGDKSPDRVRGLGLKDPEAVSVYEKTPKSDHHFPFACVLHFKEKADAVEWWRAFTEALEGEVP